jgi:hypothetical protein
MSERKVLSKYYPPDFDPSKITRTRKPKSSGPKVITVRLMAPFPMKCTACGEYIYKGRKFNARKETTNEKYLNISIIRFYIRCTRCSAEITFKTDPKNMDYACERGAKRNFEPWRAKGVEKEETEEELYDRLLAEEEERNAMVELETKTLDAKQEMAVADALDEIRTRNARNERVGVESLEATVARPSTLDEARQRQDREDEEAARRAFMRGYEELVEVIEEDEDERSAGKISSTNFSAEEALSMPPPPSRPSQVSVAKAEPQSEVPSFKRVVKKKKDLSAALGIKKKPLV